MAFTAIYVRTSTSMQQTGAESQQRALEEHCKAKGITGYRIYQDQGVSGAKASRPALGALIADAKAGLVSGVLTYSLSRLSRSTKHLLQTIELFKSLNVGFVSLSESIDLNSPAGMMILTVLGAVAQLEREISNERVKNGLANAKAKGIKLGRPTSVNRDVVRALVIQNLKYREIAKLTGASHWTIREVVKELGRTETATSGQSVSVGKQ